MLVQGYKDISEFFGGSSKDECVICFVVQPGESIDSARGKPAMILVLSNSQIHLSFVNKAADVTEISLNKGFMSHWPLLRSSLRPSEKGLPCRNGDQIWSSQVRPVVV